MKLLLLMLALPAALVAMACKGDPDTISVTTAAETPNVSVSGRGEVQVPSDVGYINMGVAVTARTVAEARDQAADAAQAVITSAKQNGVDEKDIKTMNLNISPQYNYPGNGGQPTITGYTVTNIVDVKVKDLDTFSKIIDDATKAGGDNVRVNGIRFDVDDNAAALEQAREAAMADAKKKADQLAKLGDVTLGKPIAISEVRSTNPPAAMRDGAYIAEAAASTPIQPGTGTVVVELTVTWAIAG